MTVMISSPGGFFFIIFSVCHTHVNTTESGTSGCALSYATKQGFSFTLTVKTPHVPRRCFSADFVMCLSAGLRPNDLTSVGHGERRGSRWVTGLTASYPSNPSKQPQKQRRMGAKAGRGAPSRWDAALSHLARSNRTRRQKRRFDAGNAFFLFRTRNKTVVKFLIKKWSQAPQREALTHVQPPTSSAFRLQTRTGCRGCG